MDDDEGGAAAPFPSTSRWTLVKKALLWFPVVFVMGVLIYCYYAYIVTFCGKLHATVCTSLIL